MYLYDAASFTPRNGSTVYSSRWYWSILEFTSIDQNFPVDRNTLFVEITSGLMLLCGFFKVILTNTIATLIIYVLVPCSIAQFVYWSICIVCYVSFTQATITYVCHPAGDTCTNSSKSMIQLWSSSCQFGNYHITKQLSLRRACASAQSRMSLHFSNAYTNCGNG